jgi:trehalose/maltose transport system substrate-binding protein
VVRSRVVPGAVSLGLVAAVALAGCGGDDGGVTTLTWYINPDNGGQADLARTCTEQADGRYRIETSPLPNDADGQREQLVRRLAANDSSIDLMSLDPAYVAEFANAGFLRTFEDDDVVAELTDGVLDGPVQTATFDGELVAAPFWANTQLLWYRRSVAQQAGIDPTSGNVTWDQIVDAAVQTGTTFAVTGSRYEGYTVLINALVMSSGGEIVENAEAGRDATPRLDSDAGRTAAAAIRKLARSSAAAPEIDTAIEENARASFQADDGGFMVNWPYVYAAAQTAVADGSLAQEDFDDIGWARFPRTVADQESRPALGGINIGIGAFSDHPDLATDAVRCLTTVENQTAYMLAEGNSGARSAVYDDPAIRQMFPMADVIRDSIDDAGPRPQSPFYPDISAAVQRDWSPPRSVNADATPARTDRFISDVLANRRLV